MKVVDTNTSLPVLVKDTVLNIVGQVIPLLIGVVTIPYVIYGLGVERFGILSLASVVLGYFSLFDFGIGRATTKFVAEALGGGKIGRLPSLVWTSFLFQFILGAIGAAILAGLTPFLVERLLHIPASLRAEAKSTFYLLGASIPVMICSISLRGVLEGAQRFDVVNAVKIPANSMTFLIPVAGLLLGFHLPGIMFLLFVAQLFNGLVYLVLCLKVVPVLREVFSINITMLDDLFTYGKWMTIHNVIVPILAYSDRFLIGAILSTTAVAYYTPPFEIVSRLQIIPAAFAMTLFPAFSAFGATKEKLVSSYAGSRKYLMLITTPIAFILLIFAEDILGLWLGVEFAERSTIVFQILTLGFFMSCQAWIPSVLLQGIGRADIVAKVFIFELPSYVGLASLLIAEMGMVGAALAWALRGGCEAILLFAMPWKIGLMGNATFGQYGFLRIAMVSGGLLLIGPFVVAMLGKFFLAKSIVSAMCVGVFSLIAYVYLLDRSEKQLLIAMIIRISGRTPRPWRADVTE